MWNHIDTLTVPCVCVHINIVQTMQTCSTYLGILSDPSVHEETAADLATLQREDLRELGFSMVEAAKVITWAQVRHNDPFNRDVVF